MKKTNVKTVPTLGMLEMMIETILSPDDSGEPTYRWPKTLPTDYITFRDPLSLQNNHVWCPTRAILFVLLAFVPIKFSALRLIGSGEADPEVYCPSEGGWVRNIGPLAPTPHERNSPTGFLLPTDERYRTLNCHFLRLPQVGSYPVNQPVVNLLCRLRDWQQHFNPIYARDVTSNGESQSHGCLLFRDAACGPLEPVSYGRNIGSQLKLFADFLNDSALVAAPIRWSSPIAIPSHSRNIGPEADLEREMKMPSQASLDSIARIFRAAKEPRDVITTAVVGVLLSAPQRIHELLLIPANYEIFRAPHRETKEYGLRWQAGKGDEPAPKWLSTPMAAVAKVGLKRIKALSEPARKMALWYETHPNQLYLPRRLAHLRSRETLDRHEIRAILGYKNDYSVYHLLEPHGVYLRDGPVSFQMIEKIVCGMLPLGFPWVSKTRHLKYSEALFVVPLNLMHTTKGTCPVMFHAISPQMVRGDLSGPKCIFNRHKCRDEEGNPVSMHPHQTRHLLNTLALSGGMSQFETALWSGRKDVKTNRYYDQRSPGQMLQLLREATGDRNKLIGPLANLPHKIPITKAEFALQMIPTAHTSDIGWCIHDYTSAPCELIDDCINCEEHVCVKGECSKRENAYQLLQIEIGLLNKARKAREEGDYGAERWEEHHSISVQRLTNLIEILDDPQIPEGTVIQLAPNNPNKRKLVSATTDDKSDHENQILKRTKAKSKQHHAGAD